MGSTCSVFVRVFQDQILPVTVPPSGVSSVRKIRFWIRCHSIFSFHSNTRLPVRRVGFESCSIILSLTRRTPFVCWVVCGRNVGDAGVVQLTSLRRLETLDVFSAYITDFGVAHGLCRMPSLTALEVTTPGKISREAVLPNVPW